MGKKVSVIIPAYNAEKTLDYLLQSLSVNDYPKELLEIIVVDNNSSDGTNELAREWPIHLVKETRQGRSIARNRGVQESSGEYLAFLDADTVIESNWISELVKQFDDEKVGGVCAPIIPSDLDGRDFLNKFRYRFNELSTNGSFNILDLHVPESPMINSASCMYRRSAFELVGGFDEKLVRHEDIDLSKRISLSGHTLSSTTKTSSQVIFHGEGWGEFFIRAFKHGYYKNDYIGKWASGILLGEKKFGPLNLGIEFDLYKKIIKEQVGYLFKGLLTLDIFWIQVFIHDLMKIIGQIVGMGRRQFSDPIIVKTSCFAQGLKRFIQAKKNYAYFIENNKYYFRLSDK